MWELLNEEMWRLDILPINACEIEEAPDLGFSPKNQKYTGRKELNARDLRFSFQIRTL